ncbi:MAG: DsbA family protein [Actinomycetota bacterium]|nr:DsbA family protein [Actinomycetota bacterium]
MDQTQQVSEPVSSSTTLVTPVTPADHVLGPEDAPVTIVEYGEFECPHCGRAHFQLKSLRDRFDELGVRLVFRHLARDDVHPFSVRAAVTSEAAARQGRFWEMHDHLFEHQHQLEYEDLKRHAEAVGLDLDRFLEDVRDPQLQEVVKAQGEGALRSGVEATPTFFFNGRVYDGSYQADALVAAIESAKAGSGQSP